MGAIGVAIVVLYYIKSNAHATILNIIVAECVIKTPRSIKK